MIRWTAVLLVAAALFGLGGGERVRAQTPPFTEPPEVLQAALHCPADFGWGVRGPVLLVPGTGLSGPETWDWSYVPALRSQGFDVCTVDMLDLGVGDAQVSGERVAFAIRQLYALTGKKVAVVGYSQGGLNVRWALKFWPEVRGMVSDAIGLAPANHGTDAAAAFCGAGACPASIWQMVPNSRLIRAVNAGGETVAGVDWTVIYSRTDDVVIPPATMSSLRAVPGARVRNVAVQEVCPDSGLLHIQFPADGTVFALVLDALLNPGPADPARVGSSVCGTLVPGVSQEVAAAKAEALGGLAFQRIAGGTMLTAEPALKPYAAAALAAPTPTPAPPRTGTGAASADDGGGRWLAAGAFLLAVAAFLTLHRAGPRRTRGEGRP